MTRLREDVARDVMAAINASLPQEGYTYVGFIIENASGQAVLLQNTTVDEARRLLDELRDFSTDGDVVRARRQT